VQAQSSRFLNHATCYLPAKRQNSLTVRRVTLTIFTRSRS